MIIVIITTVPTNKSVVTVMQADNNQSRQDNGSSQVEHTNGLYMCILVKWHLCIWRH